MNLTKEIRRVVIADDDLDDSEVLREALGEASPGIGLQAAHDGRALMVLLQDELPDLLFLDLDMPHKNGLECLLEIRGNEAMQDLPIVVFSSTSRPSNIQTAYELGADLFFSKPSSFGDILTALRAIIRLNWGDRNAIRHQYCVNGRYVAFS